MYGVAVAKISIGYKHLGCAEPVWETRTATLQGFDVDISDIGGWGLDIHHHYNFHEGILQKGDGTTLHLKQYPRTVKVVMGTGIQRPLICPGQCGGPAKDARLLTPGALAAGPDGSLYVGDFNLVRRITPDGKVSFEANNRCFCEADSGSVLRFYVYPINFSHVCEFLVLEC